MPPSDLSDLLGIPVGDPGLAASGHRWRLGRSAATPAGYSERRAAGGRAIHADRSGQGRSLPSLYPDRQSSLSFDGSGDVQAQRHVRRGKSLGPGRSLRSVEHSQLWPDPEQRPRAGCALSTVALADQQTVLAAQQDVEDTWSHSSAPRSGRISWPGASPPAGRRSTWPRISCRPRSKRGCDSVRTGVTCWPPAAYNPPASRQPQSTPRFPDWCPRVDGKVGAK
jgi:hypothetical protein